MADSYWNRNTLESRIEKVGVRKRYPGGSPNETEIAAYAAGLPENVNPQSRAVVLGMTPELRSLALARFARVTAIDSNPQAIALYRDWIEPRDRGREDIIHADWFALPQIITQPVSAVLADGVFGNLPDCAAHARLLATVAEVLAGNGRFATRMAMIPDGFNPAEHRAARLLDQFRAGAIDTAEFGFGMRLVGHHETCYDAQTCRLDNAKIFALCDARRASGELNDTELAAIRRYYFGGTNCILPQCEWEKLLSGAGWKFRVQPCAGKSWYQYYRVYSCWRDS